MNLLLFFALGLALLFIPIVGGAHRVSMRELAIGVIGAYVEACVALTGMSLVLFGEEPALKILRFGVILTAIPVGFIVFLLASTEIFRN